MAEPTKPLIVMFLGVPGSGKSFFARQLAERIGGVRLNSDAMRLSIFGSLTKLEKMYHSNERWQLNAYTLGAMNYAAGAVLDSGHSVIYDAHHTKRADRTELEKLAAAHDAQAVLVYIKTSHDVALERGVSREAAADQRKFTREKMQEVIEHFHAGTELPGPDEFVIEISGEVPFEEQFTEFQARIGNI